MATGIGLALAIGAVALLVLLFRGGVAFYQKILGLMVYAALFWFYRQETHMAYTTLVAGDYRQAVHDVANLVQVAMPILAGVLSWLAFLSSSVLDAGRILVILFVLFILSAVVKVALL